MPVKIQVSEAYCVELGEVVSITDAIVHRLNEEPALVALQPGAPGLVWLSPQFLSMGAVVSSK